ncbi:MAG: hypothetical protein AB7L90_05850 [Hyphomicrobiaceae bacterium]
MSIGPVAAISAVAQMSEIAWSQEGSRRLFDDLDATGHPRKDPIATRHPPISRGRILWGRSDARRRVIARHPTQAVYEIGRTKTSDATTRVSRPP